ncbi:dephospho-CoA kinase [Paenisporosarcina antarctica]|uniref:Dephospho-CoA kinase n=1 Tax=Paenisporosarcina antarctica TaxID=417367 RepID=A0A4V1AMW4_9BACL|nr:dephospho-CoA kinase [Paenisporosarcina antarctica]QBP40685.1 dephospho-CoA kinase [Paenisporosarcina antarctica]
MIIGLTGSIASGKSTISAMLKEKGFPIIDADLVARQVVEPGTANLQEIERVFGHVVMNEDGTLNRDSLGQLIFHDPAKRKQLNDLMHPAIRNEMLRMRDKLFEQGQKTIIMDIPLLFESRLQHFVDKILVVSVTEEMQLHRLMKRNSLSKEEAETRIQSQLPISEKEKGADAVIYNNGSIDQSKVQLESILVEWDI